MINITVIFSAKFLELQQTLPDLVNKLLMSEEAHFYMNSDMNCQNYNYWTSEQLFQVQEHHLYYPKLTVWCAVLSFKILGPIFFENDNSNAVTVTTERY